MSKFRFNGTLEATTKWLAKHSSSLGIRPVVVRDLYGRIRVALRLNRDESKLPSEAVAELNSALVQYGPGDDGLVLYFDDLIAPDEVFKSDDLRTVVLPSSKSEVLVLDRQITGADWTRKPFEEPGGEVPRVAFYGFKGGAGRSTALSVFARHQALAGKNLLVIDLDLESPGIGGLLLAPEKYPPFGVVDWFVEDAVGQAGDDLMQDLAVWSGLAVDAPGSIRVIPAHGAAEPDYLSKLSRVYLATSRGAGYSKDFAFRLHEFVARSEQLWKPDMVLLDCRAGLHDLAAVALARLKATALLFAIHSAQTWQGYNLLFQHWQMTPEILSGFRDNLKVVDALVPETERQSHRAAAVAASHNLFTETIYETAGAESGDDVFNFDPNDSEAPHFSLPIYWNRAFQNYDPVNHFDAVNDTQVMAAFGDFVNGVQTIASP